MPERLEVAIRTQSPSKVSELTSGVKVSKIGMQRLNKFFEEGYTQEDFIMMLKWHLLVSFRNQLHLQFP